MSTVQQERWKCPLCGASGWWTPSTHIGPVPLRGHDRLDGRKCIKAGGSKRYVYESEIVSGES